MLPWPPVSVGLARPCDPCPPLCQAHPSQPLPRLMPAKPDPELGPLRGQGGDHTLQHSLGEPRRERAEVKAQRERGRLGTWVWAVLGQSRFHSSQ